MQGARTSAPQWGLMYQWHDKAYLGGAHGERWPPVCLSIRYPLIMQYSCYTIEHPPLIPLKNTPPAPSNLTQQNNKGLCGIVYTLLHCLPAVRAADPSGAGLTALTAACDTLAAALLPSGNLPSSLGSKDDRCGAVGHFTDRHATCACLLALMTGLLQQRGQSRGTRQ